MILRRKLMKKLTMRKDKDGYTKFYYGRKNVTALWMSFFSSLSMEDEKNCVELFIRKYGKKLEENRI